MSGAKAGVEGLAGYFTPAEVAALLKLSETKVREMFRSVPGVVVIEVPKLGRRPYRTIRIPAAAIEALKCT